MTYLKEYAKSGIAQHSSKYPYLFTGSELTNIVQIDGEDNAGVAFLVNIKNSEVDQDLWKIEKGNLAQGFGFKSYSAYDFALEYPEYQDVLPIYQSELASEDIYEKDYETFNSLHRLVQERLLEELHVQGFEIKNEEDEENFQELVDSSRAWIFETLDWQYASTLISETDWSEDVESLFKK